MSLPTIDKDDDRVLATGTHMGFAWSVLHNTMGYRCGYVSLPVGHPWHGKSYGADIIDSIDVHGGITFGKTGTEGEWWLGFDCAHGGDAQDPELPSRYRMPIFSDDRVCTQSYVESQCLELCVQAKEAQGDQT